MNKVDRQKFHDLRSGDSITYTDPEGAHCEAEIVGWRNVNGNPALLIGEHGEMVVTLGQVVSRSRNGATKKWSEQV